MMLPHRAVSHTATCSALHLDSDIGVSVPTVELQSWLREWGVGFREQGVGSGEWRVGSRVKEVGSREWGMASRQQKIWW